MFSTQAYLSVEQKTSIVLDASQEKKLQLNFNVTLYHLPCRFATLDIVDVMGTHFQNVSTNIIKTRVETDAEGRGVSTLGRHAQKPPPPCVAARLPTALHSLPTAHCPLPTAHCPLPTAHCPLPTACPLLTAMLQAGGERSLTLTLTLTRRGGSCRRAARTVGRAWHSAARRS